MKLGSSLPIALTGALVSLLGMSAHAAPIVWGAAATIAGDTDVSTLGTLNRAFYFNATDSGLADVVINGVTFVSTSPAGTGNFTSFTAGSGATDTLITSGDTVGTFQSDNAFVGTTTPFTGLSTNYKNILDGGISNDGTNNNISAGFTFTLNALTIGTLYQLQVWTNDSRFQNGDVRSTVLSDGTTSVTLSENLTGANGGLGQSVRGTFTASATTQMFTAIGTATVNPSGEIAALQVRAVPEPSSVALGGIALGLLGLRRRRQL